MADVVSNPYFSVPFTMDELPSELREVVRPAINDSMEAERAYLAIEESWEGGLARTPATLLAYAFLRFIEACEIMVDDQADEARRALELTAEARRAGAAATPSLVRFEAECRDLLDEVEERTSEIEEMFDEAPAELDGMNAAQVAHELAQRGRHEEAVLYYERAIQMAATPALARHYAMNRAGCLVSAGRFEDAAPFLEQMRAQRFEIDDEWIVDGTYFRLIEHRPKEAFSALFGEAVEWSKQKRATFPCTVYAQDTLLERAISEGHGAIALHIVRVIESSREGRVPKEIRQLIDEARRRFEQ